MTDEAVETAGETVIVERRPVWQRILKWLACLLIVVCIFKTRWKTAPQAAVNRHALQDQLQNLEPVPRVERITLQKLRYMEMQAGWTDEDEVEMRIADRLPPSPSDRATGYRPLYAIPDPRYRPKFSKMHLSAEDKDYLRQISLRPSSEVDTEVCPYQPDGCRFLLPAWIGEQETKAQMHLYQLGLLARALNRTLVLPNVFRSRMTSCSARSFDFYYQPDAVDNLLDVRTVSLDQFANWTRLRDVQPSAQIISIERESAEIPSGRFSHFVDPAEDWSRVPSKPKRRLCLDQPNIYVNFSQHAPQTINPAVGWRRTRANTAMFAHQLISQLQEGDERDSSDRMRSRTTPNVLVVNYELRHPVFHPENLDDLDWNGVRPFSHFEYASAWQDLGSQVISKLGSFIAVHWRQETLPSTIIQPCVDSLIDKFEELVSAVHTDIKTVYMATDYPLHDLQMGKEGVSAHSGTFAKLITEDHHVAMTAFLRSFEKRIRRVYGVQLTTLGSLEERLSVPESSLLSLSSDHQAHVKLLDLDPGLAGIIDKAVLSRADVFLAASPLKGQSNLDTACGKGSSFTAQVIERRAEMRTGHESEGAMRSECWHREGVRRSEAVPFRRCGRLLGKTKQNATGQSAVSVDLEIPSQNVSSLR